MPEPDHIQMLNSHLGECKRLYESLNEHFPNGFGIEHIPVTNQDRRDVVTKIHLLFLESREIDKFFKKATLEGAPVCVDDELLEFYRIRLEPERPQLNTLFSDLIGLPNVDIDYRQVRPQSDIAPIWNILVSGLDFWKLDESGEYSEEQLERTEDFLYNTFFEPDEWMRNNDELTAVAGTATQRIPSNVTWRLKEVYRSFTLGNYLSAIALARAILEYAIVDRATKLGINAYSVDPAYPNRTLKISYLVDDAVTARPEMKNDMETIVNNGNRTLHPKKRDQLVLSPPALHDMALSSVQAICSVIEKLYLATD